MHESLTAGLLVGLLSLGAAPASAALLYIDDANGNIGTVDTTTKAVNVIGNTGLGGNLTDIGFTANGNLYGTTFSSLYAINANTGASALVGNYGSSGGGGMNALVGSGNGLLAASNATTSLYSVGVSPFSISTLSGSTGGFSAGDLAFGSAGGSLYETQSNGNLVKITTSGGAFTSSVVGNTGNDALFGLATDSTGVTYAISGTEIYTVNLSTAALTAFDNYSGHGLGDANGTAFMAEAVSPVPLPGSAPMFGAALAVLGAIGYGLKRKRAATA